MERFRQLEKPRELFRDIYVVLGEHPHILNANAYLIGGSEPTLIDCGSVDGIPSLQQSLHQIGIDFSEISKVIATHGHRDHISAAHSIQQHNQGAQVLLHAADRAAVESADYEKTASYLYTAHTKLAFDQPVITGELEDGDIIDASGKQIEVYHTPGHTPGSICLRVKADGLWLLFSGDTVFGGYSEQIGSDLTLWKQSLLKLKDLDFNILLTGHTPFYDLPVTKKLFEDAIPQFGAMLNPWFKLG